MKNEILIGIEIIKRVIGRKIFHLKFISKSYRNRGMVPRTHRRVEVTIIKIINEFIFIKVSKKMRTEIKPNRIILIYSDKKINANHPPIYSTLNPETNSDSPSAKSKGLRLVSAKQVVNHIIKRSIFPQKKESKFWDIEVSLKV